MAAPDSIFKRIIKESLVAFPQDAHHNVLQYLMDAGMDESQSLKFRQSWSKVVLGTQAFGRTSKHKIDPDLFSEELIRELSFADDTVVKIMNAAEACLKLDHHRDTINTASKSSAADEKDLRNPRDGIASLDAITMLGDKLAKTLTEIYFDSSVDDKENESGDTNQTTDIFESIGQFRKSLRGTRIGWKGGLLSIAALDATGGAAASGATVDLYTPLDPWTHGYPDAVRGLLDMQLRTDRQDINVYMTTDEIIGLVVSNKQSVHQERGWNAYLCLNELLSSHGANIFPLPVGIHREPTSLATTFAFESAAGCEPLPHLLGPALGTYLRRMPVVAHAWCAQFAAAHASLLRCTSGSLMKPINFDSDIYVRENGLLLIGNVAFDAVNPAQKLGGKLEYSTDFLQVSCDTLAKVLCLSRTEHVFLQDDEHASRSSNSTGMAAEGEEEEEEAGFIVTKEPAAVPVAAAEHLFSVVVGSALEIVVGGHQCTRLLFEDAARQQQQQYQQQQHRSSRHPTATMTSTSTPLDEVNASAVATLRVNAATASGSYEDLASIVQDESGSGGGSGGGSNTSSSSSSSSSSCKLLLKSLKPGILSLHLSAVVNVEGEGVGVGVGLESAAAGRQHMDRNRSSSYRRRSCRVRVIIVPDYPIESVLLQDMIGHVEEAYRWSDPRILMHARLFRSPPPAAATASTSHNHQHHHHHHEEEETGIKVEPSSITPAALLAKSKDVQKNWQDLRRILKNYGIMHLPSATH